MHLLSIYYAEYDFLLVINTTIFLQDYKEKQREKHRHLAVYPCKLKILPEHIFNSRDPIVLGVNVEAGTLRVGTPIIVPAKGVRYFNLSFNLNKYKASAIKLW